MPTLGVLFPHETRRVELLLVFIHSHYKEIITKEAIAIKLNDDPQQLQALMKVHTGGLTIHRYHEQYRLSKALEDLENVDNALTISAIAEMHGYRSADYFRKVLKVQTGKTPKEIRAEAMRRGNTQSNSH